MLGLTLPSFQWLKRTVISFSLSASSAGSAWADWLFTTLLAACLLSFLSAFCCSSGVGSSGRSAQI